MGIFEDLREEIKELEESAKHGHKSSQRHFYISSAPLTPKNLLNHARMEWDVESMHWLLDVHFSEDKTAVWDMNVQKVMSGLSSCFPSGGCVSSR